MQLDVVNSFLRASLSSTKLQFVTGCHSFLFLPDALCERLVLLQLWIAVFQSLALLTFHHLLAKSL